MTTKQIAEYLGKPEKTVRTWAAAASAKSAVASAKLAEGTPNKPADWDLAETCQIIAEGMGEDVAAVYRTNAANAEMVRISKPRYSAAFLREYRLTYGIEAAKELMAELGFAPKAPANQIPFPALPAPDPSFADLIAIAGEKGARQAVAVLLKVARAESDRKEADRKQGRLL